MASCTTPTWGSSTSPQVRLTITEKSSTGGAVTLAWKLEYVAHGYALNVSVAKSYKAVIDGATVKSGSYAINGKTGTSTIASGTKTISKSTSSRSISFSCSMTFNAYWGSTYAGTKSASGSMAIGAKASYKITYNANGGSGAPGAQTRWWGQSDFKLSTVKPTRNGYSFQGWSTSAGGGVAYQPGAHYGGDANLSLYAVWKANTYTVSYNANGGTGAPGNQTKTYGVNLTLSSTKPTRTNYNFKGWGTSAGSSTVAYAAGATYTANASVTLYAIWELAYTAPRITNLTVDRCNSGGTVQDEGTYAIVKFDWACDKNVSKVAIEWGTPTSGKYPNSVTVSASGTSGVVSQIIGGGSLDTSTTYEVLIVVDDNTGQTTIIKTLSSTRYAIDFKAGGRGIAIGKAAEQDELFDVGYEARFRSNVVTDGKFTAYGGNKMLQIYVDPGNAIRYNTDAAAHIFNSDVEVGGTLTAKSTLTVGGQLTANGNANIKGNITVNGSCNKVDEKISARVTGVRQTGTGGRIYAQRTGNFIDIEIFLTGCACGKAYSWYNVGYVDIASLGATKTENSYGQAYFSGGGPAYADGGGNAALHCPAQSTGRIQIEAQCSKTLTQKYYIGSIRVPIA